MKRTTIALALLLIPLFIFAIEYRYVQTIGKKRSIQTFEMQGHVSGEGYSVTIRDSDSPETHRLRLAADLSTLE